MEDNVFLIGFMGSGKSHWGKIWAPENQLTFYDLDEEIERATGLSVSEIFAESGEDFFRMMERDFLRRFENKKGFLLSCGGGTPCFFDNMRWMKKHGKVIYMKAEAGFILRNLLPEISQRPLLQNIPEKDLLDFIKNKLAERQPVYEKACHILDTGFLQKNSLKNLFFKEGDSGK